jgi:hypothetical protein
MNSAVHWYHDDGLMALRNLAKVAQNFAINVENVEDAADGGADCEDDYHLNQNFQLANRKLN